jgi:hypothetical protein
MQTSGSTRLWLVSLALAAVFALSAVASASAKEVLYKLSKGAFPATFVMEEKSTGTVETTNGEKISCKESTGSGTIGSSTEGEGKTAHLGVVTIKFTGCSTLNGLVKCQNTSTPGEVEFSKEVFHLGLADPSDVPAQLISIPSGLKLECAGVEVKVAGELIGALKNSKGETEGIGKLSKENELVFEQSKGIQKYTEFLLALTKPENELMTKQFMTWTKEGKELQSGQESTYKIKNYKNSAAEAVEIELVEG